VFDSANRLAYDFHVNHLGGNIYSISDPNPGFVGDVQDAFTQSIAFDNLSAVPKDFQPGDFNAVATSTTVDFSSPVFDNASASGFQSYRAQDAWDQAPVQNDFAANFSRGQTLNDLPFNPAAAIQPLNTDMHGAFVHNDFGLSMHGLQTPAWEETSNSRSDPILLLRQPNGTTAV
jgi:hypothetical protein